MAVKQTERHFAVVNIVLPMGHKTHISMESTGNVVMLMISSDTKQEVQMTLRKLARDITYAAEEYKS